MRRQARHRRRLELENALQQGFTLLELLVGLTVFSLTIVTLYSGFGFATRSWEVGETGIESSNELRLVSAFLRRQLGKAFPMAVNDDESRRVLFEGSRDRMVFVAEMPSHLGRGGLHELTLSIDGVEQRRLTLARRLVGDEPEGTPIGSYEEPRPVVEDVISAEFAYFGSPEREEAPAWHDDWKDATSLPLLVRVRLETRSAGQWPDLVVDVHADEIRQQRASAHSLDRAGEGRRIPRRRTDR